MANKAQEPVQFEWTQLELPAKILVVDEPIPGRDSIKYDHNQLLHQLLSASMYQDGWTELFTQTEGRHTISSDIHKYHYIPNINHPRRQWFHGPVRVASSQITSTELAHILVCLLKPLVHLIHCYYSPRYALLTDTARVCGSLAAYHPDRNTVALMIHSCVTTRGIHWGDNGAMFNGLPRPYDYAFIKADCMSKQKLRHLGLGQWTGQLARFRIPRTWIVLDLRKLPLASLYLLRYPDYD